MILSQQVLFIVLNYLIIYPVSSAERAVFHKFDNDLNHFDQFDGQSKPKKTVAITPRAVRSTAEGTTEVTNLLFYKQFELRLQELKQIWNEIRLMSPFDLPKKETSEKISDNDNVTTAKLGIFALNIGMY